VAQPGDIPISTIDIYGLRTISEAEVRKLLPFSEGDTLKPSQMESLDSHMVAALGVHDLSIQGSCCYESGWIIYIGVEETPGSRKQYRETPKGGITLPVEIVTKAEQYELAVFEAAQTPYGSYGDDFSEGHSLMDYPPGRAIQEQFLVYAEQHGEVLLQVLHESANAQHRAIAAMVIAYSKDKASIVADLTKAARDPDFGVRNNATRALGVIAVFANNNPETRITIQPDPFIDLLNSVVFTDRNKGLFVLEALTQKRQPELLRRLQEEALSSLIDVCRWKFWAHASTACLILQRIVGLPDQDEPGAREPTIEQAKKVFQH
jgi:hypothetical protein